MDATVNLPQDGPWPQLFFTDGKMVRVPPLKTTPRTVLVVTILALGLIVSFRASSQDNTRFTLQASSRFFSPNDDGLNDSIVLNAAPHIGADEALADWFVEIFDGAGNVVRAFRADRRLIKPSTLLGRDPFDAAPLRFFADLEWDGRDNEGRTVEDGLYTIMARVVPAIGPVQESWPLRVVVDTTGPAVTLRARKACYVRENPLAVDDEAFTIEQKVAPARGARFHGIVRSIESGEAVEEKSWVDDTPTLIKWNGRDRDARPVPFGYYTYELSARDPAGNESYAESGPLLVAAQPCVLDVIPEFLTFSPNGDGLRDKVKLGLRLFGAGGTVATVQELKKKPDLKGWSVQILASDKKTVVRTFTGAGSFPEFTEFDGRDERARVLPDSLYYIRFTAASSSGLLAGQPLPIRLDVTPPQLKASTTPVFFEPDEDSDPLTFHLAGDDVSKLDTWILQLRLPVPGTAVKRLFRRWGGRTVPSEIRWTGRGDGLTECESLEEFEYEFMAYDKAGNRTSWIGTLRTGVIFRTSKAGHPDLTARLPEHGFFDRRTNRLTAEGQAALEGVRKRLERYGRYRLHVNVHAAIPGVEEQNLLTTEERAWNAFRYFKTTGLPRPLFYRGMGETEPLVSDTDPFANYRNERVEIHLRIK